MDNRKAIALLGVNRSQSGIAKINLRGPYDSKEKYSLGLKSHATSFGGNEVLTWNDSASLPLLSTSISMEVFLQLPFKEL